MRAPVGLVATPLLAAAAVLLLAPGPALADPGDGAIGLSPDGTRYADSLEGPLFPETLLWVPGDRRRASWWVRNDASDTARLAVEVPEDVTVPWWLAVSARGDDGWGPVASGRSLEVGLLEPGEARRVDLRVGMRPEAGNASEREDADLRLRVRLTEHDDSGPGGGDEGGDGDGGDGGDGGGGQEAGVPGDEDDDGLLPGTGSDLGPWAILLAFAAIGAGLALLRRRREPDPLPDPGPARREPEEVRS